MTDTIIEFIKSHAFNIAIIILVLYFVRKFAMVFVRRLVQRAVRSHHYSTEHDEKQREETLVSIVNTALRVALWVFGGLLLLAEIGIDITPLLAGAGVAGVALGFGAQSMVKDFVAGMFIITENQYRVGDVVELNQTVTGRVEMLTLRKTVLRDLDGMLHHVPNGEIEIATNMTMEFANVNLDIGVGYATDIDKLEKIINKVGAEIAEDEEWKNFIFDAPTMLRLDEFADSAIIVKITGKTAPMKQWSVTGELRRRLKKAFDKNDIEIPFPQRVIHQQTEKPKKNQPK